MALLRQLNGPGKSVGRAEDRSITAWSGKEANWVIGLKGNILTTLLQDCFKTWPGRAPNKRPTSLPLALLSQKAFYELLRLRETLTLRVKTVLWTSSENTRSSWALQRV
jgi:hypothetical protein